MEPSGTQEDATTDVVVIGAGAAGLMCAMECGNRGRRVVLLEHNDDIGRKIRISGGGRCNFTNVNASPEHYISGNPRFAISALSRYTPFDIIALVEKHGIPYYEKKLGQLFCEGSAEPFIEMFRRECLDAGVAIELECAVESVTKDDGFLVRSTRGTYRCQSVVVATGGLSIPKIGATDFGHRLARQFGHAIVPLQPALVPFTHNPRDSERYSDLSGIAIDARVECNGISFRENVLFTHRGLSGPAILQISNHWNPGDAVTIDLWPDHNLLERLSAAQKQTPKLEVSSVLHEAFPQRMAHRWCEVFATNKPLNRFTPAELQTLSEAVHAWRYVPGGTEGYRKAEVTRGGVDTRGLSPQTMESRTVPGLYFIGEVVDVTGWLGGYNFQWAWSSAHAAAQNA